MKETKILSLEALRQAMTKQESNTFTTTKGGEFTFTPKFCEKIWCQPLLSVGHRAISHLSK
ncbi:hypothetical protein [Vibrio phage J14]|nr:hypothetical protein [Vibrio phage J14]